MTHRYIPRRIFSGSRINRDRREDAFARSVIARAAQLNAEQTRVDAVEPPDICPICATQLSGNCEIRDDNYPYCSKRCAIEAHVDDELDGL